MHGVRENNVLSIFPSAVRENSGGQNKEGKRFLLPFDVYSSVDGIIVYIFRPLLIIFLVSLKHLSMLCSTGKIHLLEVIDLYI